MKNTILALLLLLVGKAAHQVESVSIKKYNQKHSGGGLLFTSLVSLFSMLFFLITDKGGLHFPKEMFLYAVPAGICYFSASYLTFLAYECGSFVMTGLFLSYNLLFSIGYGLFFLKDPATPLTYAGLVLILLSIFLVRNDKKEGDSVKISPKWVICMTLSVVGCGMLGVLMKMQQLKFDHADNEFMIVTLGVSALTLFVLGLIKDRRNLGRTFIKGAPYATLAGISNGATNLLNLTVTRMIPLSISAPSSAGIGILFSFLLALFLFKERLSRRQLVGVAMGAVALVLLNLS